MENRRRKITLLQSNVVVTIVPSNPPHTDLVINRNQISPSNEIAISNNQIAHSNDLIKFVQGGNNLLFPSNMLCRIQRLTAQFNFVNPIHKSTIQIHRQN